MAEYSQQVVQRVSSEAGEQPRWAQAVHAEEQSELAALMQQLAAREACEESLRQALQDADVVLREQVAKAYHDGPERQDIWHRADPCLITQRLRMGHRLLLIALCSRHLAVGPHTQAGA